MPGKIKVKVLAGRNLPVMDRAGDTTDAFVEIKFGSVTHKTDVCRKSLNPHWSSTEWYRFEVDESELQDEPLQLRLMDHDTYSANDAIGKVVISLAPLLAREANNAKGGVPPGAAVMSGWIPVFDTMHGIRGELNVIVKVELFSDFNKYKTSSCGVQFFHCPMIPSNYNVTAVHGFVEELVVNDDPEYQWIDKIRTPRASNEARQVAFIKLSNQVQRLVGLKAAELGANAVVGYQQDFDLEGEAGVVARAIGTAVSITPLPMPHQPLNIPPCTQQQLRKYLDILATDTESITDLNQYFSHHQDELHKLLNILHPKTPTVLDDGETDNVDDDEKSVFMARQLSSKNATSELSLYQDDYVSQKSLKHISDDQIDLNKLLKGSEDSDSDSTGPLQKIKKLKTIFFTKKFGSIRSRKSDKQDDQVSIQSTSSETSRISITDIKNEFQKFKRMKKPKFRKVFANKQDEGVGMASILARSVIHAHTSLACIAENQDSEHSPSSTMRRTSESEPTINMSDDDKNIDNNAGTKTKQLEMRRISTDVHSSLHNINIRIYGDDEQIPHRKLSESCPVTPMAMRSENFLKLPNEAGYYGSLSLSGDSSEVYTSSEEDDESSDPKTDNEKIVETTSSVVQSVLRHNVNPDFIAQMERKLSIFDEVSPRETKDKEKYSHSSKPTSFKTTICDNECPEKTVVSKALSMPLTSSTKTNEMVSQVHINHHHFKLHNPFSHKKVSKTVSAPSSPTEHHGFVYRSSKRIRRQLSKISKSKMLKSISHYSLIPKKNHTETKTSLSQPGSFSDSSKAPSETVLGSPFISYADLLSLDNESVTHQKPQQKIEEFHSRVKMYIGSEPESRASMSVPSSPYSRDEPHLFEHKMPKKDKPALKPTGLVHTAMETILMDKVQSLLVPTSPQPIQSMEKRFFDDVTEKLEQVEGARLIEEALNRGEERTLTLIDERNIKNNRLSDAAVQLLFDQNKNQPRLSSEGLFSDNSSLSTSHNSELERKSNAPKMGRNQSDMSIDKNKKQDNLVQTAMKIILLDKVQSLVSTDSEPICPETPTFVHDADQTTNPLSASEIKNHGGMLHNAMETILMDKAQTLISSTITESIEAPDSHIYDIIKTDSSDQVTNQSSLFHSAMETMLIDKLQSVLISSSPEPKVSEKELESKTDENTSSQREKGKMLLRQDSTYEISEPSEESRKMSKEIDSNIVIPCILSQNKPFLKHFHPILSGAPLETIPSLPETSFDRSESLDVEGVERTCDCPSECDSETNSASVCDNSHAACRFDRSDRDTDPYEDKGSPRHARHESYGSREPMTTSPPPNPSLNASSTPVGIHRRSSDSDLSVTPKGGSLNTSGNAGSGGGAILRPSMNSNNLDMLEYPFLTMSEYPPGFIVHLGGTVCARSVKLVDPDGESAARAAWWAELRTELRAHARALRCNAVIAYTENAAICEDVCVLSASGTAAVINLDCEFSADSENQNSGSSGSKSAIDELESESCTIAHVPYSPGTGPNRAELSTCGGCRRCRVPSVLLATCTKPNRLISYSKAVTLTAVGSSGSKSAIDELESESCTIAHVPYSPGTGPNRAELSTCGGCRRCRVPSVLLATCTKPNRLISYSKAVTLTAVAARVRRVPPASEPGARDISDQLPFLEYELHKLLVAKLRMQGANALFSLQTQITIGDRCVMALASGTAFRLAALPSPTPPRIKAIENDKDAIDIQKKLWESFTANKAANGYDIGVIEHPINCALPETEPESEAPALDLGADKDTCVLELDETEDVETAKVLAVRRLHMQMQVYNNSLKPTHGAPPHAFTQVWRARLVLTGQGLGASVAAEKHVARALDGITFKLRRLQPCALVAPRIQIELPEVRDDEDEIQIIVSGTAIPLQDPNKSEQNSSADTSQYSNGRCGSAGNNSQGSGSGDADDDIFALDEDQLAKPSQSDAGEDKDKHTLMNGQPPTATTVSLTTLSGAAGARGVRRVCALRLLFVRETTAVRELGGLSGFLHTFTCEVLAIVRAYTAALGGNALTSFYITQLMLQDNAHKNQGQCLLSVGGDVVCITY